MTEAAEIKVGDRVRVCFDGANKYVGTLEYISPTHAIVTVRGVGRLTFQAEEDPSDLYVLVRPLSRSFENGRLYELRKEQ